jgi:hypothetical protein
VNPKNSCKASKKDEKLEKNQPNQPIRLKFPFAVFATALNYLIIALEKHQEYTSIKAKKRALNLSALFNRKFCI